jgi:hypothetical protein
VSEREHSWGIFLLYDTIPHTFLDDKCSIPCERESLTISGRRAVVRDHYLDRLDKADKNHASGNPGGVTDGVSDDDAEYRTLQHHYSQAQYSTAF